jgi:DNA-binding transcriptional ArsR family regulator
MKDIFRKMSFRGYLELTDPKVMRALAHPARTAILNFLHEEGSATATECAEVVGESPSACSYHLRKLAEFGFVEQADTADGRERRWRSAITGYGIPKEVQDRPEVLDALRPLARRWFEDNQRVIAEYLATEPKFTPLWRKAATFTTGAPYLTPDQLMVLTEQVRALLAPYEADRSERPAGAERVHLTFVGVPWPVKKRPKAALRKTTKKTPGKERRRARS